MSPSSPRRSNAPLICGLVLLALSVGLAAPATGLADAVYGGTVRGAGDPIVLKTDAKGQVLKSAVVAWSAPCASGNTYRFTSPLKVFAANPKVLHLGSFETTRNARGVFRATYSLARDTSSGSALQTMTFVGKLKPGSASGTLKADVTFTDAPSFSPTPPTQVTVGDTCSTGTRTWTAAHRPGTVYGGQTGQGEPLVLRTSPDRKQVARIDVGWAAPCVPDGFVAVPDSFTAFPLDARGRFGDTFSAKVGETNLDYDLHGVVSRSSASGTFSAKSTFTDGTVCTLPAEHWNARSQ